MRPLCIAAFAVAAAMAIAHWALPFGTAHIAASVALVCGLIVFTCSRIRRSRFLKALTLAALALALGFAWRWGWDSLFVSPALAWDARTAAVEAEALATAQATDYGARVAARLTMPDGRKYSATLYLRENLDIRPGDKMALDVACKAPQPGSADDILAFWRPSGIVLRAVQSGGALSVDSPSPVPVAHWPAIVADTVRRELNRALPPQEAALAQGLLIGDSSALDESFLADLGNTGMTHAMSVSGMHISFLVGAIILLMGNRKRAFWVGLPVVFLFVAAAGFPASAVRAGIMQACLLFSYVLGREEDSLTALSLSLLVLLALNPYAVADAGLQLSFASSLGIILFSGRFRKSLASCRFWPEKRLPRLRAYVFSSISLSLSVLAFSAPLVAVYFQTFSLIAPVANLLAMWLLSFLFLGSIALVCFSLIFAPLAAAAAAIMAPALRLFAWLCSSLSRIPFAALKLQSPFFALWCLLAYMLFWLYLLWPKRQGEYRKIRLPICGAATALAIAAALSLARPASLEIVALDVGQGQCLLVFTPEATAVIDCGGGVAHVARHAVDTLMSMGRSRIDVLAVTHAHADHAAGIGDLVQMIDVSRILLPGAENGGKNLQGDIPAIAQRHGIPLTEINETTTWLLGSSTLTLFPPYGQSNENELCMAVMVSRGDFDFLVTGDMNHTLERTLVRNEELPDIEVLIVGHHGSKYAAAGGLLDAVKPEVAIISVGRNSYGHPAPETVARLWQRGIDIYRTDKHGTVRIQVTN